MLHSDELAGQLLQSYPEDISPLGEVEAIQALQLTERYYAELPAFMRYNYDSGTGIASISAQTDLNEWEKVAYVCLVDAYIDETSDIARSYDFVFVTVLGEAFGSANSPPSFAGLEPEYSVTYPGELSGSFTIRETDEDDLSTLIATVEIGGDFTADCGCMDLQASYAGESGLVEKADLITAMS